MKPVFTQDELKAATINYGLPVKIPANHPLAAYNPDINICMISGEFARKSKDASLVNYNLGPHYIITGHPLHDIMVVGESLDGTTNPKLNELIPLLPPLNQILSVTPEEAKERFEFTPAEAQKIGERFGARVRHAVKEYKRNKIDICEIRGSFLLKKQRNPSEKFNGINHIITGDELRGGFEDVVASRLDAEQYVGVPAKLPVITVGQARTFLISQSIIPAPITENVAISTSTVRADDLPGHLSELARASFSGRPKPHGKVGTAETPKEPPTRAK